MLLKRLARKFAPRLHRLSIAGIEHTAPVCAEATGLVYVSQLCHRDVGNWLVAIKSVIAGTGPGEITVLDDGSLTDADKRLLTHHIAGLNIVPIARVRTDSFPKGGTWERLLLILDLMAERYVVQVDADLLALSPLTEVIAAIRENRGFTLAGEDSAALTSVAAAASQARQSTYDHIQIAAERVMDQMPGAEGLRYVRGCSGFAGFPRGCSREHAVLLSSFMRAKLGQQWNDWGSEQVASNFVIANSDPEPIVLPWLRYPAFNPQQDLSEAALIHFIGPFRYNGGVYRRLSRQIIRTLPA